MTDENVNQTNANAEGQTPKRGRGRPKGSKNKKTLAREAAASGTENK